MSTPINVVNARQVTHISCAGSIFEETIRKRSAKHRQECLFYSDRNKNKLRLFFEIYSAIRHKKGHLFVFHEVRHPAIILVLSLLIKNFQYALFYWGGDFYSSLLPESRFDSHCLRKSRNLSSKYYPPSGTDKNKKKIARMRKMLLGLIVVRRAAAIFSLTPKQYRFVRYFHWLIFKRRLETPRSLIRAYSHSMPNQASAAKESTNAITVLICHSATPTVAPRQSLEILRQYCSRWNIKIHVRGFLSYSGGSDQARSETEKILISESEFAESVYFERTFLSPEALSARLADVDLALFSCLRDEGVSLLTELVRMGGIVCFNRFSMNYDFFRYYAPQKLLDHEAFMNTNPQQLISMRHSAPPPSPAVIEWEKLGGLKTNNGKLILPPQS